MNPSKKTLNFLYANVRSLATPGRIDELRCVIESFDTKISVVILTETWIKDDLVAARLDLPNYSHYSNYRTHSRGGGVSIYVHNDLKHEFVVELYQDGNHFLWIHLDRLSLEIGAVYKPPTSNTAEFLENYENLLSGRKRTLIFGDINLDLLSKERDVVKYKHMLQENGFKILNKIDKKHGTRETERTNTILDHVCTNLKDNPFKLTIIDSPMTDHKQIFFELQRCQPARPQWVQYTATDFVNLYKTIKEANTIPIDNQYENFESTLLQAINNNKVTKTKRLNLPKSDWINKHLIQSIKNRNTLWNKLKTSPQDEELRKQFKDQRNKVHHDIRFAKNTYYYKQFTNCEKNPFKTWQLINNLSKNKTKTSYIPTKLNSPMGVTSDPKMVCECFNKFFTDIGSDLATQITTQLQNHKFLKTITEQLSNSTLMVITPTTVEEVEKIIDNLKTNTSCGLDGISTKIIKCVKDLIVTNLTACINKCLNDGCFPNTLKVAKVTPIFKSGNKLEPGDYRPISVLPVPSKIFEKILHDRLSTFLNSRDFISKYQYGFRPKSSTLSATVDLVTKIKRNIDQRNIVLGICIDLKKAFDTVSHDLLLQKLQTMGINGTAYEMFKSYITNRYQIVKINEHQSQPRLITCGVPQGSILGPLLFLIFINDIQDIGLEGDITLYADDTSLFYYGQTMDALICKAQRDLDLLHAWMQTNLLTINVAKTNYIIFAAKNKPIGDYNELYINGEPIQKVTMVKYLGLILDSRLSWEPHIEKIRTKLRSLSGALRGIARCLPTKVRYNIYNSLVRSNIEYLIETWGSAAISNLKPLQRAQNKIIKTLFGYKHLTPTTKIYKETKLLNLCQMYNYNTCILVRKILTRDIHSNITFTKRMQIQKRVTRQANNILLQKFRTNYGKRCIMYEGAQIYNKLPKDIKDAKTLKTFKKLLRSHIERDFSLQ